MDLKILDGLRRKPKMTLNKKKNILLISTNSDESGAPRHVETLVNILQGRINYIGYISGDKGPVFQRLEQGGMRCFFIKRLRSKINLFYDAIVFFQILFVCLKLKPDIIHLHSSKAGILGRVVAMVLRTRCLYTVHGWGWRGMSPSNERLIKYIERILYKLTNVEFIAVSESVRQEGIEIIGISPDNITTILNGIDDVEESCRHMDELGKPVKLIMPARVCAAKDHSTLVKSFSNLSEDFELILCGEGTDSSTFVDFTTRLAGSSANRIKYLGQRSDINELIAASDILLLSSHFEALPLSLIEGMRAGLPVIGTDVGGVREIISPNAGVVVDNGSVYDLTLAIWTLANPSLYSTYSINSRQRFCDNFSAETMGALVLDLYESDVK